MKNALWNVCEFCAAVVGLLVLAPRLWVSDRGPDFEHMVRRLEADCASRPSTLY